MAEQELTPMVSHEGAAPTPQQVGVNCVRVFGVLQILLSLLYLASCKAADFAAGVYTAFGFGMWGGIWILVGGIICLYSSRHPANKDLNGLNMVFAFVSSFIAFLQSAGLAAVVYYLVILYGGTTKPTTFFAIEKQLVSKTHRFFDVIFIAPLCFMLVEFVVSFAAAIYCCKFGCSAGFCGDQGQVGSELQQSGDGLSSLPGGEQLKNVKVNVDVNKVYDTLNACGCF